MRPSCKRMPTKLCMMVEAGADHPGCIVVTTCCSGFASIQLSMSGDGKRLNPRTSKSILFLHGCHNLYFRRNHVADVFCSFRRNHIADCILIFFVNIMSPMYFDDVFGHGDHAGELLLFEDASLISLFPI